VIRNVCINDFERLRTYDRLQLTVKGEDCWEDIKKKTLLDINIKA